MKSHPLRRRRPAVPVACAGCRGRAGSVSTPLVETLRPPPRTSVRGLRGIWIGGLEVALEGPRSLSEGKPPSSLGSFLFPKGSFPVSGKPPFWQGKPPWSLGKLPFFSGKLPSSPGSFLFPKGSLPQSPGSFLFGRGSFLCLRGASLSQGSFPRLSGASFFPREASSLRGASFFPREGSLVSGSFLFPKGGAPPAAAGRRLRPASEWRRRCRGSLGARVKPTLPDDLWWRSCLAGLKARDYLAQGNALGTGHPIVSGAA